MDKLNYIQSLGVTAVYFNPLFVSPSNHKYDIQDYEHIDPHFGVILKSSGHPVAPDAVNNEEAGLYVSRTADRKNLEASDGLFLKLVQEMHRRGMRVIIDGVFNHCGSFNKWLDRELIYREKEPMSQGLYQLKSPIGRFSILMKIRTINGRIMAVMMAGGAMIPPKLNYEGSPDLEQYVLNIAKKWVSEPYCVDGWRLDVAADLGHSAEYNHSFWKKFRKEVKTANPDALILAEHYGDPSEWLQGRSVRFGYEL